MPMVHYQKNGKKITQILDYFDVVFPSRIIKKNGVKENIHGNLVGWDWNISNGISIGMDYEWGSDCGEGGNKRKERGGVRKKRG